MKTIVEKIRTIVRLEYKFDDDYINYDHIDCIMDDWNDAMSSLWESYFGRSINYADILEIIILGKEEGNSQEEVVNEILRILGWNNYNGFFCGMVELSDSEIEQYHNAIKERSRSLGINIADCWEDSDDRVGMVEEKVEDRGNSSSNNKIVIKQ